MTTQTPEPPMPEPTDCKFGPCHFYTGEQMRDYAARAVQAERERRVRAAVEAGAKFPHLTTRADLEAEIERLRSELAEALTAIPQAVRNERERCAKVCEDEARIRADAGRTHPEDSEERGRCYAAARAAYNCATGVRNGEEV